MAITITPGYSWTDGEVVTATKLNLAAAPTASSNGSYLFSDGTAAAPSISFSSDTDIGFYRYAANTIGWSYNGLVYGTLGAGVATLNGDDTTGAGNLAQFSFGFGGAFSYQHFLQTRHNSAVGGTGNAAVLWLNNSATAGASSAPGTNNVKAFDFSADNLKFYSGGGTLGLTMTNAQGFVPSGVALSGTSVAIDFNAAPIKTLTLSGNTTFTTSNLAAYVSVTVVVLGDGSSRTLTFPSWKWVSSTPTALAANKNAVLSLLSRSTTDANVIASWVVEA
tara:strand:- start:896 stop:1729 length:834 start_codon:yes stop_codon:yes gene_type:complete